jgi:hypothetical protein
VNEPNSAETEATRLAPDLVKAVIDGQHGMGVARLADCSPGDGIDGLLGMIFLSRFNINIDGKTVRISPRTAR